LVAAGLHDNPVPVADVVTTTTHKTLRGPRAGLILSREEYAKDIDRSVFPGIQGGPLMHAVAGKAVCFGEALSDEFKRYTASVIANAKQLAEDLKSGGLNLISGGTDNHLVLADVTPLGVGGKLAEKALDRCGITVNKNMIPYDQRKPMDPSGIRFGTPALTTRGMGTTEMTSIAQWIVQVLGAPEDEGVIGRVKSEIEQLCEQFPVPANQAVTAST
jgi:glycine hydroxymethyltransferase